MTVKKTPSGAIVIQCMDARLSFPHLFEPQRDENGKNPKYNGIFIMAKDNPAIAEITAEIKRVAQEKWPQKHAEILQSLKASGKLCLRNGDTKAQYEGFEGNIYISASNKIPIKVFNRNGEMITEGCEGSPYAGCYVNVSVELWVQDNQKFGKRINASLRAVQFVKDGESFGGGSVATEDEFGDLGEGSQDEVPPEAQGNAADSLV